jgi:hypothetical protein
MPLSAGVPSTPARHQDHSPNPYSTFLKRHPKLQTPPCSQHAGTTPSHAELGRETALRQWYLDGSIPEE